MGDPQAVALYIVAAAVVVVSIAFVIALGYIITTVRTLKNFLHEVESKTNSLGSKMSGVAETLPSLLPKLIPIIITTILSLVVTRRGKKK